MATLLATKLSNQLNKLAEQAGLEIECNLHNFYGDGRRASGCNGEVHYPETGARVEVSSHVAWRSSVRIKLITPPHGEPVDEVHIADASDAAKKIVSLLTPGPITHDNLAESRISNLPSLERNPLLAAYLSDASTGATSWVTGRSMLERTILAQGFDPSSYTHYPYLGDDTTAYSIGLVLRNNLAQNCAENHMVCHHLLAYHDVRPSETVKGRLAYFQDDDKRAKGLRTTIKVRKYLQKFFKDLRSDEELEQIAKTIDELLTVPTDWDVRLYSDASLDGWADAYYHVGSCMNTRDKLYGVGKHETYRCYCTSAMTDGAKSSGLTLAVLYQDGEPVARAITYEDADGKYFVRNYGDDRLVRWLKGNDYKHQPHLPYGTHLWTEAFDVHKGEYLSPHVDGDDCDAEAELTYIGEYHYWIINGDGMLLQNSCGYSAYQQPCNC